MAAEQTKKLKSLKDPLPLAFNGGKNSVTPDQGFLRDTDPAQKACIARSYPGFERNSLVKTPLHIEASNALEALRQGGFFHYDLVQYAEKVNTTRVQRVLVGEPGITYLYQKLRLFALPWTDESVAGGALVTIAKLNREITRRSKELLAKKRKIGGHVADAAGVGRCDFNLTLINAALTNDGVNEASNVPIQPVLPFKPEKRFHDDKVKLAVNWHRDSTLEPFSTIGVYHHTPDPRSRDWEIAMCCDRDGLAPPVTTALKDGEVYYMLGNFNHHHQHAVVAGSSARYASTHRVALTQDATYEAISERCAKALVEKQWEKGRAASELDPLRVRLIGELCADLEFEWIRQFYVQGAVHAKQHSSWWTPRIESLEDAWAVFDEELYYMVTSAIVATGPLSASAKKSIRLLVYLLETRTERRKEWENRVRDKAYARLPPAFRPVAGHPDLSNSPFPEQLTTMLDSLRKSL